MVVDSTYHFFKREFDDEDGKHAQAPVISTARISRRGGFRSGSVPPIHLGAKVSRSGSVPPRRSSIARAPVSVVRSVGTTSTSVSRVPATVTASSLSSSTGYLARPLLRRASIAAPGGSSIRIYTVGSGGTPSGRSGVTEVTKNLGVRSSVYRPSSQSAYGRSAATVAQPKPLHHGAVFGRSATASAVARTTLPYRRASISSTGWWDEDLLRSAPPPPSVARVASSTPLPNRRSYAGFSRASTASTAAIPARKPLRGEDEDDVHLSHTALYGGPSSRRYGFSSKETFAPKSDNDIHPKQKLDYESQLEKLIPMHEESLSTLRARTQLARDHLSRHKVLLDRYLPLQLGPENEVLYEVESRYGELLSRMPQLEQRERSRKQKDEYSVVIPPYKPAAPATKAQKLTYEISSIPVKNSFTPKISDTRKRARNVLCKIHGDPRYFDFS